MLSKDNNEKIKELETKLLDISSKFEIEVKKISYDKNWEIFDFFTPLQAVTLAYGFEPSIYDFKKEINEYQLCFNNPKHILNRITEFHRNSYEDYIKLTDNKNIDKIYIDILSRYYSKLKKMQFLFNVIIENLKFNKIRYDASANNVIYVSDIPHIKIHKFDIRNFLQLKNIESEFFETTTINNENDFYKIPKNHKCVTPKTKALIETLLHFIKNETELHDAQSGIKEAITQYLKDNNTYKISQTAIEKEITPIINWTHKKDN